MRGEQHVGISVLSAGVILGPWIGTLDPFLLLLAIGGVFVGSMAPDADADEAAILHGLRGGKGTVKQLRQHTILGIPWFGYVIRYLIYYPVSALLWAVSLGRIRPHHRGILHSIPGILAVSAILIAYLWLLLTWAGISTGLILPVFGAGFFTGCCLHLLEDSCTRSGIVWAYPFSRARISGSITNGNKKERRPERFLAFLATLMLTTLIAQPVLGLPQDMAVELPLLLLAIAWALFLARADIRRHPA
jgi:inner membrane protein